MTRTRKGWKETVHLTNYEAELVALVATQWDVDAEEAIRMLVRKSLTEMHVAKTEDLRERGHNQLANQAEQMWEDRP